MDHTTYQRMSEFLRVYSTEVLKITPDDPIHPSNVLVGIEKEGLSLAKRSLAMALGDTVEATADYSEQEVSELDKHFTSKNVPTLSEVKLLFSKRMRGIMRKKRIESEEEYYLVRNAVEISEEKQRAIMWDMLADYESSVQD